MYELLGMNEVSCTGRADEHIEILALFLPGAFIIEAVNMSARRYQLDSHAVDVAKLAQPLQFEFSKKTAPNRLVKTAMSETLASWHPTTLDARGLPTKELIELYKRCET